MRNLEGLSCAPKCSKNIINFILSLLLAASVSSAHFRSGMVSQLFFKKVFVSADAIFCCFLWRKSFTTCFTFSSTETCERFSQFNPSE